MGGTLERDGALRFRYRVVLLLCELIAPIRAGKDGIGWGPLGVEYEHPSVLRDLPGRVGAQNLGEPTDKLTWARDCTLDQMPRICDVGRPAARG